MINMNYGKKFEEITRNALTEAGVCHDRLPDQMSGLAGSTNPSDFTAYQKPHYLYIECKSCQEDRFDIKTRITEHQWITLLEKSEYEGVYAGYLIWFVVLQKIYWIPAVKMKELYQVKKSFTVDDLESFGVDMPFRMKRRYPQLIDLVPNIVKGCAELGLK